MVEALTLVHNPELFSRDDSEKLALLHPALGNSAINFTHDTLENGHHYAIKFGVRLEADDVKSILTQPLEDTVGEYTTVDFLRGLKAQTYPNSRLVKNAAKFGKDSRVSLRNMRADLLGLLKVFEYDSSYRIVAADVHLYDDDQATNYADIQLAGMKPAALVRLCTASDMEVNELLIWRQKGGKRGTNRVKLAEVGADPVKLRAGIVDQQFVSKALVDREGLETVLIPRSEMPSGVWAEHSPFIEKAHKLPHQDEGRLADRWRVYFRQDNLPVHVVRPVISWTVTSSGPLSFKMSFDYRDTESYYSPSTHQVVHASPLIGAALLAGMSKDDDLQSLSALYGVDRYKRWLGKGLPPQAIAALPAMIAAKAISMSGGEPFSMLEHKAYALASPFE